MTNAHPPGFRPFTDRAAMEQHFRQFLVNPRPIHQALVPIDPSAPPIVILDADSALRDLVRLHVVDVAPGDGGDVIIDHRLMADTPRGVAKIALRFAWSTPAVYKMTVILKLPKHVRWLLAALRTRGAWCQPAPMDAFKPAIWLPVDHRDLGSHVMGALVALAAAEVRRAA